MYRIAPPNFSDPSDVPADYQVGLCSCGGDLRVCCYSMFCPCYVAGKIAEKVGESCGLFGILSVIPLADCVTRSWVRQQVRKQKGIPGNLFLDIMTAWCCYTCSLCQDASEVQAMYMAQSMSRE